MMRSIGEDFGSTSTKRLLLRRPRESDLQVAHRIHADPATNTYNPAGPDLDLATTEQRLLGWIAHWDRYAFGYWAVEALENNAEVIGFAGLRRGRWSGGDILNLYYRFGPAAWGRGFASEASRQAVLLGSRHFPDIPVIARTTPENVPSQRTALAAGLIRRTDLDSDHGEGRDDGMGQSIVFSTVVPNHTSSAL